MAVASCCRLQYLSLPLGGYSQHLVESNGQLPDAPAGSMEDSVGHSRRGTDNAQFAETLDAQWIDDGIVLFYEDHFDLADIGVDRHMVFRQAVIDEAPECLIDYGFLVQRHADSPDQAAQNLATCGLGVENATPGNRAH